jgi:RNA polymerase sigma-70 factor (ECF subfamily)
MTMPPHDLDAEHALLARLKQGDERAFTTVYRRHKDAIYRFALLYCGSPTAAADVTQDVFLHLITQPGQFDPARGSLGAWLCGIARNMARRQAGARERPTDPADLADDDDPIEAHVDRVSPLDQVLKNEEAERVLILCELSDLTYAEAAQVCGIDIGTVRSRLSRARAQLARRLAPPAAAPAKEALS